MSYDVSRYLLYIYVLHDHTPTQDTFFFPTSFYTFLTYFTSAPPFSTHSTHIPPSHRRLFFLVFFLRQLLYVYLYIYIFICMYMGYRLVPWILSFNSFLADCDIYEIHEKKFMAFTKRLVWLRNYICINNITVVNMDILQKYCG